MPDCNFVIGDQGVIAEPPEDLANSDHAEGVQFRCAERAHTRSAEHVHSLAESQQDLLVPDRWHGLEIAVDDPDKARFAYQQPGRSSLLNGRQIGGVENCLGLIARQARAEKDIDGHDGLPASFARTLTPGQYDGELVAPSSPGTITRTTEIGIPG